MFSLIFSLLFLIICPESAGAYDLVGSHQKISYWQGGFAPPDTLHNNDHFGTDVTLVGDLDGDGIEDIAVTAPDDDDGGNDRGAVYILFLNADETVRRRQKISDLQGNFGGTLDDGDNFGISIAALGDHDADGVEDIVVGTSSDDDGGMARGAVRILFLNSDGTVKSLQKISDLSGNFTGILDDLDNFGRAVGSLGDLDGDGVGDIAVGAYRDDDGGSDRGAVWVLFLNANGTVKSHQKISDSQGNFTGVLDDYDYFSRSIVSPGDLDGDTVQDMAVGANFDDDGGTDRGAVWILFMNTDGTVKSHQKISSTEGAFSGALDDRDYFGRTSAAPGDLDGDSIEDLVVGAFWDDDGGSNRGAVWVLFLNANGTVKNYQKISDTAGNFTGVLNNNDYFGNAAAALGDRDGDGVVDIAVGAYWDDDGGADRGAAWILCLNTNGTVKAHVKISDTEGRTDRLGDGDSFGRSIVSLGDLDGDGIVDLAAGAPLDDDAGSNRGAVYVLFMNTNGTVKSYTKISVATGDFTGAIADNDYFGSAVGAPGDLDSDGMEDLIVGASGDDDGGSSRGAVWVLFLNADGTVKSHQKISDTEGLFSGTLADGDRFGCSTASLGDLDGDGVQDCAVGAYQNDGAGMDRGAVWVLFLNTNGTVKSHQKISDTTGNFSGPLANEDLFGSAVAGLGDFDGDTVEDMAVGAPGDDDGGTERGAVWVLFLNTNGTVKGHRKISATAGGFAGALGDNDRFGSSLASLGDLDGDGAFDIAAGASGYDASGIDRGAAWVLFMDVDGTVKDHQNISGGEGNFTGVLADYDYFGCAVASLGDLDGDGMEDCVIGACGDDDGGPDRGATWVLYLDHILSCTVHPAVLDFGIVSSGGWKDQTFMIINSGLEPLNGMVAESCGNFGILSGGGSFSLSRQESLAVTVRFDPATIGSLACMIETGEALCNAVSCIGVNPSARIDSIADVPRDEGGWVRIFFSRSVFDNVNEVKYPIRQYDIHRRIDDLGLIAKILKEGTRFDDGRMALLPDDPLHRGINDLSAGSRYVWFENRLFLIHEGVPNAAPPGVWEVIGYVSARQQAQYIYLAPSVADSAVTIPWSVFFVAAHTTTPSVFFDSLPDSGYSVDNTILCVPESFNVAYNTGSGNRLAWDPCLNENFDYYRIYRGPTPDFPLIPQNIVYITIGTQWNDPDYDGWNVHYKITSVTIKGRESDPASPETMTAVLDEPVPGRFSLYQNVPNPFNPSTSIQYDIPVNGGFVTLRIYDVRGRLVRKLVEDEQTPGVKRVLWNGRDDAGRRCATGIYFYRLTAPDFVETRKMLMLK